MKTGASCPLPRCGCCDRLNPMLVCEDCGEPMCTEHWKRVGTAFVCTVCVEARTSAAAEALREPAGVSA